MAKRFPFFVKHHQPTTPYKAAVISSNNIVHTQGIVGEHNTSGMRGFVTEEEAKQGTVKATEAMESDGETAKETVDTAWDAAKNTTELVTETTTAEADTNVVDTVEYRSSEDLMGDLGDGHDKIEL